MRTESRVLAIWAIPLLATAAILLGLASWWSSHAPQSPQAAAKLFKRAALPPPPPIEPLELRDLSRDDAVKINDAVPFVKGPVPPARPFRLSDKDEGYDRAVDCLASAMLYEAGSADDPGQRAVAQVVLNRLRHPAFPKTICGVVFQGAERTTGCQFTFTCDGALARTPPPSVWEDARRRAKEMLAGKVFKSVGYATHYHTNWVVPYWSETLDKIAAVNTHLFFRWTGWWGTPGAFRFGEEGPEPTIGKLAFLSPAHKATTDALKVDPAVLGIDALAILPASKARKMTAVSVAGDTFLVVLDGKASPDSYPALALQTCGDRPFCKLMGWTDPARAAAALPLSEQQIAAQSFSYLRNRSNGFEKMLWNCRQFKRADPAQCMKPAALPVTPRTAPAPAPSGSPTPPRARDAANPPAA